MHRRYKIQRGTHLAEALNTEGSEIWDFRPNSPFISETLRDKVIVSLLRITNKKSQAADRCMSIRWHSVTLTGEGPVFLADHVWPRTAKFGKITHVSMGVFVGSHARPHSKRRGPSILTAFGIYICPCGDITATIFYMVIKQMTVFLEDPTPRPWSTFSWHHCWRAICMR